jgi:hypothetical protein
VAWGEGSGYGVCVERAAVSVSEGRVEGEGLGRVVFSIGWVSFNGLRANVELDPGEANRRASRTAIHEFGKCLVAFALP